MEVPSRVASVAFQVAFLVDVVVVVVLAFGQDIQVVSYQVALDHQELVPQAWVLLAVAPLWVLIA